MAAPKKKQKKESSAKPKRSAKESKSAGREKREPQKPEKKSILRIFGLRKKVKKEAEKEKVKTEVKPPKLEVSKAKPARLVRKKAPAQEKVAPVAPAVSEAKEAPPTAAPVRPPVTEPKEVYIDRGLPLPQTYGEDRISALAKDPNWIFVYWELAGPRRQEVEKECGRESIEKSAWVLRVHDLSLARWSDVGIDVNAGNWYVPVGEDKRLKVEIGIVTQEGKFIPFASSRPLQTPRSKPSREVSEEWMVSDATFRKFLELSFPSGTAGLSSGELARRVREATEHIMHPHE